MTARRLPTPSDEGGRTEVSFTFDGRAYRAPEGEPLAIAMLAADRPILSRSFRFHRPRGLMCDTGQCGWCECEVDGRPSVRSCREPVRDGLVARSEHAWPSVDRDLFGLLDLGSRWVAPTFYHHRFLRPRALRKRYLDVIRGFGGRGRLQGTRPADVPPGRVPRTLETDVLVIGGGPAGRAAADAAARDGRRVLVIEAVAGRARPTSDGAVVLDGATAIGWYDGVVTAIDREALWSIRAASVVAAAGSYERVPAVRGADRPGVMGARRVLDLINRHRMLPGERPLLIGDADLLADVGAALAEAGAAVSGPFPTAALRRVIGRRRVTGALVATDGRPSRVATDLLVFGDRTPNLDFVLAAGASVERRDGTLAPVLDEAGRTTVGGLSVVGSAVGPSLAGRRSARRVAYEAPMAGRTLVCFCEDVHADEIHAQVAAGYGDPELVKRRTGALTGPCQGKYCLQAFARTLDDAGIGGDLNGEGGGEPRPRGLPTARPPLRPVRLGDLVPRPERSER